VELDQSLRNQFVVAMQQKLDISQIHAEINLSTAQHLGKDQWISSLLPQDFCFELVLFLDAYGNHLLVYADGQIDSPVTVLK